MRSDNVKDVPELSFSRATWSTLGAGFLLAMIALLIADWPHSSKLLNSRLCLSGELDNNIFQMLANERARVILKSRYYDRRGREAGPVRLSLSQAYVSCLYEEALSQPEEQRNRTVVSRSSLGHDLRSAIERIPFSEKTMTLTLDCDREEGIASSTLHLYENNERMDASVVLNIRKLDQSKLNKENSIVAAGSGPVGGSTCL